MGFWHASCSSICFLLEKIQQLHNQCSKMMILTKQAAGFAVRAHHQHGLAIARWPIHHGSHPAIEGYSGRVVVPHSSSTSSISSVQSALFSQQLLPVNLCCESCVIIIKRMPCLLCPDTIFSYTTDQVCFGSLLVSAQQMLCCGRCMLGI